MRWFNINPNPNSIETRDWRRKRLDAAWQPAIKDRQAYLAGLCRDRTVLDVGCVDHFVDGQLVEGGLFHALTQVARCCVGVDINEVGIARLKERGFLAATGDITSAEFEVPGPGAY